MKGFGRDWRTSLRPASFRGLSFYVDAEEVGGGRRVVFHTYPGSDAFDLEDLGANPKRFSIGCYFASDTADAEVLAFTEALHTAGAGPLVLPMRGYVLARPIEWRTTWVPAKLGYVGVYVTWAEEGSANAPTSFALAARLISVALSDLGPVVGRAVGDGILGQGAYERLDTREGLSTMVALVETVRASTLADADLSRKAQAALIELAEGVAEGAREPTPFVTRTAAVLNEVAAALGAPVAASVLSEAMVVPETRLASVRARQGRQSARAAYGASVVLFGSEAIGAVAAQEYRTRPAAIAARERVKELAARAQDAAAELGPDAVATVAEVAGLAADLISRKLADLAPIVRIETARRLPSTLIAWQLYGDPTRALDLVERNGVATSVLMPTSFEADGR